MRDRFVDCTNMSCLPGRYVEEVRDKQLEEDEKDTSSFAGQQATAKVRRCLCHLSTRLLKLLLTHTLVC